MAVYDQQGQRHHSASRASLADRTHADKQQTLKSDSGKSNPTPTAGASKDVSNMDPHEVVSKHGPAHKVEVTHNHESGEHHVTSHHKGAHHKSQHGSAHEAHMHGAMMAGDEGETPDESLHEPTEEENEGVIPGMG